MGAKETIKKRITRKQKLFIEKYRATAGNVSLSCKEVGISRTTYYDWINKSDTFKQKLDDVIEENHDFVESKLLALIKNNNPRAIEFYLRTKAKHRGYSERVEFKADETIGIDVEVILPEKED